jgi:alkanesulfonate monooxygenase SsuD/methylene tetrahydromethanopterin reductase-like flavin-dependent oxidoreductase (luciferase family)
VPPFTDGSVSVGLSAIGKTAAEIVTRLVADANIAVASGFDGVTLSEHHGGFPHYVSSPLTVAAGLLGRMPRGWAAAAPAILPLRAPEPIAEDLAWTAALHPGRVAAGFVAGYQERDFQLLDGDFANRRAVFWSGIERIASALAAGSHLAEDPAVAAAFGLPLLAGVGGPVGARRAASFGGGMLITSLQSVADVRALVDIYRDAGGTGPTVLIRRVHIGAGSTGGLTASLANWRSQADPAADWLAAAGAETSLIVGEADVVASQLSETLVQSGCGALNLRIESYTARPDLVADQLEVLGSSVLPAVRSVLPTPR